MPTQDPSVTSAPAPAPAAPPDPESRAARRRRLARRLDTALAGLALLFAFLTASFAVRNSDFWLHLATGRLLAEGNYSFGPDPFAYTTDRAYWVNHAWLFDLSLYSLYRSVGGAGLVVLKALLVTALAWLMLRVRRPEGGRWLPAVCTTLALLAMSPRLLLQPACVSCFFLGLTLWLLWRPHAESVGSRQSAGGSRAGPADCRLPTAYWLLILFALWVNVDRWFLLGPLLVALFWAGERWGGAPRHTPGWLVPAGLVACLLGPHHLHALTLPWEVSPAVWAGDLPRDPRFGSLFLSPWQLGEYLRPGLGLNPAGLAYFALTALGLGSFALARAGARDWRLPVWAAFALLAALQARAVPFFAVVAGPVMALNFQDALARSPAGLRPVSGASLWGRGALVLAGLALATLSWPGWLQAFPHERRRVAWGVEADPSLRRAAETLHSWRRDGLLGPGERVFPAHPDAAHYLAWFAPGERGFLDHRFGLFAPVAREYEEVSAALGLVPGDVPTGGWRRALRARGVRVVLLHDADTRRLLTAQRRMTVHPEDWALLRVEGRALLFGWRGGGGDFTRLRLDPEWLAFGPADPALPPAPGRGPGRGPRPRGAWERFARPAPAPAWESEAATAYLRYFDDRAEADRQQGLSSCLSRYAAGLAGRPVLRTGPWGDSAGVLLPMIHADVFLPDLGRRSPALPLLAVRAARRALAANPDDANAWLRLGQAYLALHRLTGERMRGRPWEPLAVLRHVQAATALRHALALDPDLEPAHRALTTLYAERMYIDSALEHARATLRLARRGPSPGEGPEEFDARLAREAGSVEALEQQVLDRENEYAIRSRPLTGNPLAQARLALSLGLARAALDDILLQSSVLTLTGDGARLELELMLMLGRAEEVRDKLDDDELRRSKGVLSRSELAAPPLPGYAGTYSLPAYDWLRFYQAAAGGDYDEAASALRRVLRVLGEEGREERLRVRRTLAIALGSEVGLTAPGGVVLPLLVVRRLREEAASALAGPGPFALARADLHVLGGLLALERGDSGEAARSFRASFAAAGGALFGGRYLAEPYARRLRAARPTPRASASPPRPAGGDTRPVRGRRRARSSAPGTRGPGRSWGRG